MKTVIMAGGRGTRIQSLAPEVPKPMIPIDGKPVLEHEIICLREQGFTDLILTVSHMGDKIMDYFGDGSGVSPSTGEPFGVHIRYYIEGQPLGNAGALYKLYASGILGKKEDFLLLNADAVFDVDFRRFVQFHKDSHALATLFTHPNAHPYDSGLVIADEKHRVTAWLAKEDARPAYYKNRVNAGLHVLNTTALDVAGIVAGAVGAPDEQGNQVKIDLDRQVLKPLAGSGKMYCYDSPEYVKDMGTPQRYAAVCRDYASGLAAAKNLRNKQRAVFLDRDGTINRYRGFLRDIREFELLEQAADAIRELNNAGYLCIVVTNQPVVARGEITEEGLREIHNKMETLLGQEGAYVDAIYYCPHHPHKGFEGEVAELKINCDCRKPKPGMLLQAARDYHICLEESWMVGDSARDIQAGIAAGCRTVWIAGGEDAGNSHDMQPGCENVWIAGNEDGNAVKKGTHNYGQDVTASSLYAAVRYILS